MPKEGRAEQSEVVEAVRTELEQRTGWLLVFDNARRPDEIRPYLPRGSAGHVIVTSRYSAWGGVAKPLPVKVWEPEESVRFLLSRTGEADETAARDLAKELGQLPPALEQAAAYIERAGQTLAGYLGLFRRRKLKLFQAGVPGSDENATVTTTWEISFQEIAAAQPAAAALMNLCAFLAPDDIPVQMIVDGAEHLPDELAAAVQDPLSWTRPSWPCGTIRWSRWRVRRRKNAGCRSTGWSKRSHAGGCPRRIKRPGPGRRCRL